MALGSTQPLTEMSTRNLPGDKGRPTRKAENLTAICEPIVQKMWEPRRLTTLWASTARYRDNFTFTFLIPFVDYKGEQLNIKIKKYVLKLCVSLIFLRTVGKGIRSMK
jgi:hypothetical protein